MNTKRYQLGDYLPLLLQTTNGSGTPTAVATEPVTAKIYDSAENLVATVNLGLHNNSQLAHLYRGRWLITTSGYLIVTYAWNTGSAFKKSDLVYVAGGGHATGPVVALFSFRRPEADYVMMQTASGSVYQGRNQY